MSSNVGLSTPRGSGTSGYVQRNLSHLRPRDTIAPYPKDYDSIKHRQRQPDKAILAHDRAREIEVKVFDLRDKLEDEEYVSSLPLYILHIRTDRYSRVDVDEIENQCAALRKKLTAEMNGSKASARGLKSHQVHELAAAKIEESEKLRKALGIREDYEEGSHWKKQEERMRDATLERGKEVAREENER
ncbi:RNA-splicing factor [Trapelia coarctata]|nr:RNA-splicing factor [Trapelia coarctata]